MQNLNIIFPTDIDECAPENYKENRTCAYNAYCTNYDGGRNCTCNPGYNGNAYGIQCTGNVIALFLKRNFLPIDVIPCYPAYKRMHSYRI